MDDRTKRRPYGDPAPPGPDPEGLPPSARLYGTPAPPSGVRVPRRTKRALVVFAAFAVVAVLLTALVSSVVSRVTAPDTTPRTVEDGLAGVRYPLPPGWHRGTVAPVTGFSSVASFGTAAVVMTRPGDSVAVSGPKAATRELADLYSRLLLHGDTIDVLDDRAITVGRYAGHTRAVRARYSDVVNQPAYLRVALLTSGDASVVVVGHAQPDDPLRRADIDAVVNGLR
ncbi:hypothetical protein [Sphaerisporangium sp. TRM90804]|uniref:hypothetical protein n=1 Tax=Sphaerisporangium sp. TRM90804 TaxID=3031113 RepID=UPI002446A2B7|nr:hypothetical protein [Sphaerisporangium sp. TRM90804]MDH2430010.1 hypothetical protein [Sphaerisporangium sp. TRM90804]